MKKDLSAMDISVLIKEFSILKGAKIDQIFQRGKEELDFIFHISGVGKRILRVVVEGFVYFASDKVDNPMQPPGFCLYLRKYLGNARVKEVVQPGFERVVQITFETKEKNYVLVIELFGKGNVILCSEDMKILSPLNIQRLKSRVVKPGEQYFIPGMKDNPFNLSSEELNKMLKESDKEMVKFIATELGLGGLYAEEVCLIAGLDKALPAKQADAGILKNALLNLHSYKIEPVVLEKDIVPFKLQLYKDFEHKEFNSYSEALDSVFSKAFKEKKKASASSAEDKEIRKVQKIIDSQSKQVESLKKDSEENKRKGELIYENYQVVKEILDEIAKARKKYSLKEIKEKLKNHKVVKEVKVKEQKVIVEI